MERWMVVSTERCTDRSPILVISYLYRFVERNERREWTPRQMGIYHSQNKASNSHVWIILQPRPDSENLFAQHLDSIRRVPEATKELLENSFRLHELLIGSFLDNWRWYLRDLGKEFQKQVRTSPSLRLFLMEKIIAEWRL